MVITGHTAQLLHLPYTRAQVDTSAWLARLLLGSLEIRTVYSGATQIRWRLLCAEQGIRLSLSRAALISRLSCRRLGTRYHTRGLDDDGHVANHVETEQLLEAADTGHVASWVTLRGSVPLFWEQPGVNVGSHKIRMARGPELSAPGMHIL